MSPRAWDELTVLPPLAELSVSVRAGGKLLTPLEDDTLFAWLSSHDRVEMSLRGRFFHPSERPPPPQLRRVTSLPNLRSLNLSHMHLDDDQVCTLSAAEQLESLFLSEIGLRDETSPMLPSLSGMEALQSVYVRSNTIVDGHSIREIAARPRLHNLTLHCPDASLDEASHELASMSFLKSLTLSFDTIGARKLEFLPHLANLRILNLGQVKFTEELANILARCTGLMQLRCEGRCDVRWIRWLSKLPALISARFQWDCLDEAGRHAVRASLPDCVVWF